ncbi:MAG: SMR family transporter [Bacillota bacterium]
MSPGPFLIVLVAAFLHAGWNMLLKGGRGGMAFNVIMLTATVLVYLPGFLIVYDPRTFSHQAWLCVVASGAVHGVYFTLLAKSYSRADLSLAYPVARGSGAALAALGSTLLLGERPDAAGLTGIAAILAGMVLLWASEHTGWHPPSNRGTRGWRAEGASGIRWALGTGVSIATYSLVDKVGVSVSHPFAYIYLVMACAAVIILLVSLAPKRRAETGGRSWREELVSEWNRNGTRAAAAGLLVLFTYLLVLFAMRTSKLSYVAPLRESSVLFSMLLGLLVLKERITARRWAAGAAFCLGVVLLGLAR